MFMERESENFSEKTYGLDYYRGFKNFFFRKSLICIIITPFKTPADEKDVRPTYRSS